MPVQTVKVEKKMTDDGPKMAQQIIMPVITKASKPKIEDVEAIPTVNESFDYSMSDPLVDGIEEIGGEPMEFHTGSFSNKNSMM
jgi:hypothetical protein